MGILALTSDGVIEVSPELAKIRATIPQKDPQGGYPNHRPTSSLRQSTLNTTTTTDDASSDAITMHLQQI